MAASTSTSYDLNRTGIIRLAYQSLQIVPAGEDPSAEQLAMGADFLNVLIKELENEGITLSHVVETTVTLTAGTASYTPANDTLDIDQRTVYVTGQGVDVRLRMISRGDYMAIPLKTTPGQPTMIYVQKSSPTSALKFFLYPVPDSNWTSVTIPRITMLTDMDSASVTSGLPTKYLTTLYLGLAVKLAPAHGRMAHMQALSQQYEQAKAKALNADTETGPLRFLPDYGNRWPFYRR